MPWRLWELRHISLQVTDGGGAEWAGWMWSTPPAFGGTTEMSTSFP